MQWRYPTFKQQSAVHRTCTKTHGFCNCKTRLGRTTWTLFDRRSSCCVALRHRTTRQVRLYRRHSLSVKLGVADENGSWGAETEVGISFLGEVPNLGFTTFYKLTNSMSLELELADFIKLVTGSDRHHCGNYIQKGGYAGDFIELVRIQASEKFFPR